MRIWLSGGLIAALGIASCSNDVTITAETTGGTGSSSSGSSSSGTTNTQGSGGASTTSSGSTSSSSGTGGAGAGGPGSGKLVAADTDMAQYQSITLPAPSPPGTEQKVVDGPFFITDVFMSYQGGILTFDTVTGGDCSAPANQHHGVLTVTPQIHGIRLPVLAGQTLCLTANVQSDNYTVLGFKPY